ncbi:asparagine synthase (glutamine-hydrolyzing) [Microvirga splendida]|uniref:asparagine synthase (glutamine-hydrolyzing) n=1 Tax=Microvirga splendida TaxID=2795727 RepID=A0ABS0Y2L1_9HYPH|nr:asparagine synthase (glutamine-hydrolyzing) [Microvirga splendida]MBJ6126170.1 asparagine synthase (glutamine-hydrolyzing) [Microvirga splendida]
MCGIAGYLGHFEKADLNRMSSRIAHRGPDGAGMWCSSDQQVGLSHRRLSIIDLSNAASQPMADETGQIVLIYNGELYNYRELQQQLEYLGFHFKTRSDTEVLLKMYLWKGVEMLNSLNGIFAFAIWDNRSKTLFVARDGVGVKPLYYTTTSRGLLFSSEMKSFLDLPDVDWTVNPTALQNYMTYHWSPGETTMAGSIRKLLPGHAFLARDDQIVKLWSYYDLPYASPPQDMSSQDAIMMVHESVRAAVERQMVADVPVGAFLSGGLDSSSVVAFAKESAKDSNLPCFTIRFTRPGARDEGMEDDLPYAHRVARHIGVDVEEVPVGPESLRLLPELIYMMDEPQADVAPINAYLISAAAKQLGIKVLLSGMGGDDIFTGYRRHYALSQERRWSWLPQAARQAASELASRIPVRNPMARKIRKAFSYAHLPEDERIASYFFWEQPSAISSLLAPGWGMNPEGKGVGTPLLDAIEQLPESTEPINRMLYLDGKFFVPDHNLNFFDKVSMACGVECRVPLLDTELIKVATSLPTKYKQVGREGKWVFKRAMEQHLPREAIYRPKTGFGMPLRAWMQEELYDLQEELLSVRSLQNRGYFNVKAVQGLRAATRRGSVDGTYTLLAIICIELWSRIFLDKSLTFSNDTTQSSILAEV